MLGASPLPYGGDSVHGDVFDGDDGDFFETNRTSKRCLQFQLALVEWVIYLQRDTRTKLSA
jgi:hypothetical protein